MSPPRRRPSWVGTLVVAIAGVVLCLRAAAQLRRSVTAAPPADAGDAVPASSR
jgi:hypothetical protein